MRKFIAAAALICIAQNVTAQRGPASVQLLGIESEVVKGAAYSADVITDSVQTLSDGNRIAHHTASRVYRDSEGRVRREEERPSGSPGVSISDPVADTSWMLDVENRVARQTPLPFRVVNSRLAGDEMERLTAMLNGARITVNAGRGRAGWMVPPDGDAQRAEEKLAPRIIEGLRVEGVRRTATVPPGAIGNERPIIVTTEEWTSPELKVLVLSETTDPRNGTSTYKLVNVKRGEPAASLFQVPSDYTVQASGAGREARGEGRGEGRGNGRGARGGAPR